MLPLAIGFPDIRLLTVLFVSLQKHFFPPVSNLFSNVLNMSPSFFGIQICGLNSPNGDITTPDFKVRRLLGDIGVGLFASRRVSTVRGLEFKINSTPVNKI